jgi:replication-associated recombination protein RarA
MTTVVGHAPLIALLERNALPQVSLFSGPKSVGKWTTAEHLRKHHSYSPGDVLRIHRLTAELAREAVTFSSSAAVRDKRLAIIEVDTATPTALTILLKTLEEPHDTQFILVSAGKPIPTIVSRSQVYNFGFLGTEEVAQVLMEKRGFRQVDAMKYAQYGRGQVQKALDSIAATKDKNLVIAALLALRERDERALLALADRWDLAATALLITWCNEAITDRWTFFGPSDAAGIDTTALPIHILTALKADIRPRLVVRSTLVGVLRERMGVRVG